MDIMKQNNHTKIKLLLVIFGIEIMLIFFIAIACTLMPIGFAIFYNGGYGILMSMVIPLAFAIKNAEPLAAFGMKALHLRQYLVLLFFVLFSIGGQLIPLLIAGTTVEFYLLPMCFLPLIMTTFFEEFLFRGFMQTRLERQFGKIIAILISGLLFSLYHIGYPGFRTLEDLLLLFAVGCGFALAYTLSDNNFWVAYCVNLPNAFLTYTLKYEQFPVFTVKSSLFAAITLIIITTICVVYRKKQAAVTIF